VIVKDGIVTLTGRVASLAERYAAELAVQRVAGVKALAVEAAVGISGDLQRSDTDIARAADHSLAWNVLVPDGRITPTVEHGWVMLTGEVEWEYQSRAADVAVRNLPGVTGVTNLIKVKPRLDPIDVEKRIGEALMRRPGGDTHQVRIQVDGAVVELSGQVHSWAERRAVQSAA